MKSKLSINHGVKLMEDPRDRGDRLFREGVRTMVIAAVVTMVFGSVLIYLAIITGPPILSLAIEEVVQMLQILENAAGVTCRKMRL